MESGLKIGVLSAMITAALVYVAVEWRPGSGDVASPNRQVPASEFTVAAPAAVTSTGSTTPDRSRPPDPPTPESPDRSEPDDADERNNIDIYRRYSRSVVNVASRTYSYDIFLRPVPASGFGSGVVLDDDGHIVTNYHVIQNADAQIEVTLADQSRHPATVMGVDPNNDLALIQVEAPDVDWIPLPMGSTRGLQVGQKVLAIGNPFGLERTLTTGIISSLGRAIEIPVARRRVVIEGIIQTDAAINEGNSGGPLLDKEGTLIGINTAIVSGATGIGFAIPVETVRRVTSDLITYGRVRRVHLGVRGVGLPELGPLTELLQLGADEGVLVVTMTADGPAAEAGLRGADRQVQVGNLLVPLGGDVIVDLDGRRIRSMTDIGTTLERHRPGDRIPVTVIRNQEEVTLQITLREEPLTQ